VAADVEYTGAILRERDAGPATEGLAE
jgi:hypothetical protein